MPNLLASEADSPKRYPRRSIAETYLQVRSETEDLASPLTSEDQTIQSMEDASPAKWHRAHTTWFFETFVLLPHSPNYKVFDPAYGFLFNSYYESLGRRQPRPRRGMITRPGCDQVGAYRAYVDQALTNFIEESSEDIWAAVSDLIELGINHEQQHQELLLMDILHAFSCNPTEPAYAGPTPLPATHAPPLTWTECEGGLHHIGFREATDQHCFHFDNEGPCHSFHLAPFRISNRLITCGEWLEFMEDGGYNRPEFWLSDGWAKRQSENWTAPLYWRCDPDGRWTVFSLRGRQPVNLHAPVCHISHYEADAYANWAGKRLPTEQEWEVAAQAADITGNLLPKGALRPLPAPNTGPSMKQVFGDVWEHTRSPYMPYPGFKAASGAVGEYNGKFMSNQMVLRGGSCITPGNHIRVTYRNFFYPHQRWMFAGLRLADDQ